MHVSYKEVPTEIKNLQAAKTTQENIHFNKNFEKAFKITLIVNFCIESSIFSCDLKLADVTPAFQKTLKDKYRLMSILPNTSKI